MKKWKYAPVAWIVEIELAIAIILFLCGFRITYMPLLENNWNAISACATWAGVVATTTAVIVAIRIPTVIAQRQDKIALFEKRFAFYEVLCDCIDFSHGIKNIQTNREIQLFFVAAFGKVQMDGWTESQIEQETLRLERQATTVLQQGAFLFDFETKEIIKPLVSGLGALLFVPITHERFWVYYSEFMDAVKNVEQQLLPNVEAALKL